ncbi:MAG: TetR/AcrR family transcriptional regulator [Candidatus Sulfotelmatobacter sp.]
MNGSKNTTYWVLLFGELEKQHYCDQKSQIRLVSTSHQRTVRRYIGVMSRAQHQVTHRATNTREMLLLSAGKLFQEVGYVRTSIHRIAAGVNAPKGTFYNYFGSKEELASILVDRQFAAIYQSLSLTPTESAYDQLKQHFDFLAIEPPMIEIAPLQLLAIFAAEAPAIPPNIGRRIADGIHVWDRQLGDLISLAHIEKGTSLGHDSTKLALLLTTCWFGAIVRRKSDPSLKLVEDFLPSLLRCGVL